MRNSPLERFCCFVALINLLAFYGLSFCFLLDRTVLAAIAVALTLNMAMGWLLVAGIGRDASGVRVWTSRPAVGCILLSVVVAAGLFFWAAGSTRQ